MISADVRARMQEVEATKVLERARRIDRLVRQAEARGEEVDRLFWTIVHDLEHAPRTTNRIQLEALGIEVPDLPSIARLEPSVLAQELESLLEAMSMIRVFIRGGEHLSNRCLLEHILRHVLEEEVADLPHSLGSREYVDLSEVVA